LTKKKIGSLAAIRAPILCFYTILVHHLINIPLEDDFETVLAFMARFSDDGLAAPSRAHHPVPAQRLNIHHSKNRQLSPQANTGYSGSDNM
jgi:hypothetical protein